MPALKRKDGSTINLKPAQHCAIVTGTVFPEWKQEKFDAQITEHPKSGTSKLWVNKSYANRVDMYRSKPDAFSVPRYAHGKGRHDLYYNWDLFDADQKKALKEYARTFEVREPEKKPRRSAKAEREAMSQQIAAQAAQINQLIEALTKLQK